MSVKINILHVLADNRHGLTAWQVNNLMDYGNFELIRFYLSSMVKKGYVKNIGRPRCDSCGYSVNTYRISEKGRERLHLYS